MAKKHKSNRRKSRAITPKDSGPSPLSTQMTKRLLVDHLVDAVDSQAKNLTTKETKQLVIATLDALTNAMERSIMPGGAGTFSLPKVMKITLKTKKAVKSGTMVRSPATGGMVPSKGRPESKSVKIRALTALKRAAAGEN